MAGPGPVSALIHAATMVKSGVYLVARFVPIFYYGYWVGGYPEAFTFFLLTAWVGLITAFLAATQGMVALELKKALAYSTVSQIGYMMLGLGVAGFAPGVLAEGYTSGIFHLVSHALFKASLFLCAGAVIHTAHSIYMQDMGSLRKYMPYTWFFMLVASLSLIGLPPLPGFWSKETVLDACWEAHQYFFFVAALVTVVFTSFYTTRFMGMIFHGEASEHVQELERKGAHLGEGHPAMVFSCAVLTLGILVMGFLGPWVEHFLLEGFAFNLGQKLQLPVRPVHNPLDRFAVPLWPLLAVILGAAPAYFLYLSRRADPQNFLRNPVLGAIRKFFWERWYIDRFYYWVFVEGILRLSGRVQKSAEDPLARLIHGKLPDLVTRRANHALRYLRTETRENAFRVGYVLFFFILSIALLLWRTP
jgi:NADH-quinone oxidoreductase subunit L